MNPEGGLREILIEHLIVTKSATAWRSKNSSRILQYEEVVIPRKIYRPSALYKGLRTQ